MPVSQAVRFRSAIAALRPVLKIALGPNALRTLTTSERRAFGARVTSSVWFRRTFTMRRSSWTPSWKGDEMQVLYELSHYLVPRETWALPREPREAWVRRETCWSFVALMQHMYGREIAKLVRAELTTQGVKYRPRRRLSAAQKAALKGRQFKSKKKQPQFFRQDPRTGRRRISFTDE